jgi:Na+/H+ antiporter
MNNLLPGLIAFLGLIGLASIIAPRVKLPAAVLLAIAGIVWGSVPALAPLRIAPGVVLTVFLPPLLYSEAWRASWQDFKRWLRPILSLAIGLVGFTILCVGVAAKALMPELPWAVCFLLGAIVSPTDTVAVYSVLSRLRVPRRALAIFGGESLVNDATGLLGVQLALAVIFSGVFEAGSIAIDFAHIAGVGIASGIAVGLAAAAANARLSGTRVLFVFSLVAPYTAFAIADALGASGIIAVVVAGFVASWRLNLIPAESRVDLYTAWDLLSYFLNALMFLFVGLEIPQRLAVDLHTNWGPLWTGLVISGVVIAARLIWFWPAAYIPLWLSPTLRRREGGYPPPSAVLVGAWCGVRGAISLAAALALPQMLGSSPFPGRGEILTATLVTIAVTLIGQGATLEPLVRWLRIPSEPATEVETQAAREAMLAAGIARLDQFCEERSCPVAVHRYRDVLVDQLAEIRELEENARNHASRRLAVSREVRRAVWQAETAELLRLRDTGKINDGDHQSLQLELDREHADLHAAAEA